MDNNELYELNAEFDGADPQTIITWAAERFMPRLAVTSSFQTQSVALLHLIGQTRPDIPVIFLDTGYHFPETLAYRDQLVGQFGLTLRVIRPAVTPADLVKPHADALYRRDPEMCCYINKVEPMQRALRDLDAWLTGIRREQTDNRAHAQPVEASARWPREDQSPGGVDASRSVDVHQPSRSPLTPAVQPGISEHRLRAVYRAGDGRRRRTLRALGGNG